MATKAQELGTRAGEQLCPRIARLRTQYFTHKPSVCIERALAYTEVFQETEGEPVVIRRAKGLKRTCETKTILIQDDELIIGNAGRKPRTGVLGPEMSNYWFDKEIDTLSSRPQDPYAVDVEQKELFREKVYPYWKGKTVIEHWLKRVPEDTRAFGYETGVIDVEIKTESGPGEIAPGYGEILLPKGWGGVRRWAEERLAALDPADPASEDKGYFLQAVIISTEAMGILARRHADAARELAEASTPERAAELERVADVCDWIADRAAAHVPRGAAADLVRANEPNDGAERALILAQPNGPVPVPLLRRGGPERRAHARRGAGAARVPVGQVRRAVLAAQRQLLPVLRRLPGLLQRHRRRHQGRR